MSATTYDDADPAGDLVLSIGPEEVKIRVSSKILSLASPVLAAMFSPRFAEGHALASQQGLANISLPEDDPEAIAWILNAVHFKNQVGSSVSLPFLEKLAIACDKYHMSVALAPCSEVWLSRFKGSRSEDDRFVKIYGSRMRWAVIRLSGVYLET